MLAVVVQVDSLGQQEYLAVHFIHRRVVTVVVVLEVVHQEQALVAQQIVVLEVVAVLVLLELELDQAALAALASSLFPTQAQHNYSVVE